MTSLPADVEVVEVPDGAYRARRYRLPQRTMPGVGCTIYSGIFALTLAVGFPLGVALFGLSIAAGDRWEFKLAAFLCPLCFFGSLLFPAALYVLLRIVFVHLGRIEIVVTRERLLIAQRWGFLGWTRRLPLRGLRGLRVITDRPFNPQDPHFSQQLSQVGNLLADYEGGRKRTLCWGYPAEWLAQLGTVVDGGHFAATRAGATAVAGDPGAGRSDHDHRAQQSAVG